MKKKVVSERSLENLKLGGPSRKNKEEKERHNILVLPETFQWLRGTGNASDMIDVLVETARKNGLNSVSTHDWKEKEQVVSNDVHKQIDDLKLQLEEVRSQLETYKALEKNARELMSESISSGIKAAGHLKKAQALKKSKKGGVDKEIEEAIRLIDHL